MPELQKVPNVDGGSTQIPEVHRDESPGDIVDRQEEVDKQKREEEEEKRQRRLH